MDTNFNMPCPLSRTFAVTKNDFVATQPQALRQQAFVQCFTWSIEHMAALHGEARNPFRAARAFAHRMERKNFLHSDLIDCQRVEIGERPLCTSQCSTCDIDRIAYQLERRFSGNSKPTRIFWPSTEFARRFGTWTGSDCYPCPHKVSHDLIVTSVWLGLLKAAPEVACNAWTSERLLMASAATSARRGPMPDAAICDEGKVHIAIEIGGNYPASWLRHHIERFEQAGWDWEIW
ncbi:MAG: hypothetical protein SGJ19_10685 [Planctomycetia bacterium]|nr:hypothetical protein [Planctomycetia bacterium]